MGVLKPNKTFLVWLEGQPARRVYESKNPWTCPVAKYLDDTIGGGRAAVYESSIEVGDTLMLLAPNHRIRRLVVAIDREPGFKITRKRVLELAQLIWKYREPELLAQVEEAKVAMKKKQKKDWGW